MRRARIVIVNGQPYLVIRTSTPRMLHGQPGPASTDL